jgi:hypothetical protein
VAGVLALMYDASPDLSPAQAYDLLVETAYRRDASPYWDVGAGVPDAGAAVQAARATDGERAAWTDRSLEELPYTDPDDPLDYPTRTHLLEEHGDRDDVRALTTYLDDGQTWPLESTEEMGHLFRFPSLGYRVCAEASLAVPDAAATLTVTVEASDRERAAGPPAGQHELTIEEPDGTEHRRTLPPGTELTFDDPANGDGRLAFDGDPVVVDRIWDVTARLEGDGPTPAWDGLLCRT